MKLFTFSVLLLATAAVNGCGSVVDSKGAGGSGSSSSSSSSTGMILPVPCGSQECGLGEFCKDLSGLCGGGQASEKTCVTIGTACSDGEQVCGCDQKVYMSEGCSNLASVSVNNNGGCDTPAAMFPCGGKFCSYGAQFCRATTQPSMTTTGETTTYSCEMLPDACGGTASCTCVPSCEGAPNPADCKLDAAGNAHVHCTIG